MAGTTAVTEGDQGSDREPRPRLRSPRRGARRLAIRPRGHLPGRARGHDAGDGPVRHHDPRGVWRPGPRPRDPRGHIRGAEQGLDERERRDRHPPPCRFDHRRPRDRRAEGAPVAAHGQGRGPRRAGADRARGGQRRAEHQHVCCAGRRGVRPERQQDVHHQRRERERLRGARQDGPRRRSAVQGDELLHRREAEPGADRGAPHRQAGLPRARHGGAAVRGLQGRRGEPGRRRGGAGSGR